MRGNRLPRPDGDSRTAGLERAHPRDDSGQASCLGNQTRGAGRGHDLLARIGSRESTQRSDHIEGDQQGDVYRRLTPPFVMKLASLLKDPPPTHAFELSEEGIAFASIAEPAHTEFAQLDAGVLTASPAHDNIQQPHAVLDRIHRLVPPNGHRKRRAALILPDYCARVAVLDFDAFPSQPHEQLALLRFRMKKSVPFDVDSAIVSYVVQARGAGDGAKVEVLAALMGAEIVAHYEAPFRNAG